MDKSFQGSIVLGMGFVLSHEEGSKLISKNKKNKDVIFPFLINDDLNSRPDQSPSRMIINFRDWPLDRETAKPDYYGSVAVDYPDCLEILEKLVKPERLNKSNNDDKWWQYLRYRSALYRTIAPLNKVLVYGTSASKYLFFSFVSKDMVFSHVVGIISNDKEWCFSLLNSNLHSIWSWKYSSTMGDAGLRYTPSTSFETFPFPTGLEPTNKNPTNTFIEKLDILGEQLDKSRKEITLRLNIGLTKLYNLYHTKDLDTQAVMSASNCDETNAEWAVTQIKKLRELQKEIDKTVLASYDWNDLFLEHGFYELEFLPENDRVRYTVSENARLEMLRRLLALNHERHKEEFEAGLVDENGKPLKKKAKKSKMSMDGDFVSESPFLFDTNERGDLI
jgi:hypothetical protein